MLGVDGGVDDFLIVQPEVVTLFHEHLLDGLKFLLPAISLSALLLFAIDFGCFRLVLYRTGSEPSIGVLSHFGIQLLAYFLQILFEHLCKAAVKT